MSWLSDLAGSATWSPGIDWPEEDEAELEERRRQRRQQRQAPPALTLGLGPFSFVLVPSADQEPQYDAAGDAMRQSASATAALGLPSLAGVAGADGAQQQQDSAEQQLQALLSQREPGFVQRLGDAGEAVDSAFFARWLKARGGSVGAAAAGIAAHVAWRVDFIARARQIAAEGAASSTGPASGGGSGSSGAGEADWAVASGGGSSGDPGVPEASIRAELAARKAFLQGLDTHGCPVVVVQAARHDMGRRDLAQTKRLIAYVLDSACATADVDRNPAGQISCIFDLAGLRPRNLDAKALLAIFELLQKHYPERLHSLYFVDAPLLFWTVWKVVSPFVHSQTRQKLHFLGSARGRQQLLACIPPDVLPTQYGGAAELVPVDVAAAAWRHRQQCQAEAAGAAATAGTHGCAGAAGGGKAAALGGAAAVLRRRAGGAAHAARRLVHSRVLRPVGGAAARAARTLRLHHGAASAAAGGSPPEQHSRSLLAQVVLTHVLLVGLLLRMLQRVLRGTPLRRQLGTQLAERSASPLPPPGEAGAAAPGHDGMLVAQPAEQAAMPQS